MPFAIALAHVLLQQRDHFHALGAPHSFVHGQHQLTHFGWVSMPFSLLDGFKVHVSAGAVTEASAWLRPVCKQ